MPFDPVNDQDLIEAAQTTPEVNLLSEKSSAVKDCYRTGLITVTDLLALSTKEFRLAAFLELVKNRGVTDGAFAISESQKIQNKLQLEVLKSGRAIEEAIDLCPDLSEASRAKAASLRKNRATLEEAKTFSTESQSKAFKEITDKVQKLISQKNTALSESQNQLALAETALQEANAVLATNPDDQDAKKKAYQANLAIGSEQFGIQKTQQTLQDLQNAFTSSYIRGISMDFTLPQSNALKNIGTDRINDKSKMDWWINTAKRFTSEHQVSAFDLLQKNGAGLTSAPRIPEDKLGLIAGIASGKLDPGHAQNKLIQAAVSNNGGNFYQSYLIEQALVIKNPLHVEAMRAGAKPSDAIKFTSQEQVNTLKALFTKEYIDTEKSAAQIAEQNYKAEKKAYDAQMTAYNEAFVEYQRLEFPWQRAKSLDPSFNDPEPIAPTKPDITPPNSQYQDPNAIYPTVEMVMMALGCTEHHGDGT